jgi:hypothetical protein
VTERRGIERVLWRIDIVRNTGAYYFSAGWAWRRWLPAVLRAWSLVLL